MVIDYDPGKSDRNAKQRGLPFSLVSDLEWESAIFSEDTRHPYRERRIIALGYIASRLHVVCFTPIKGGIRVISFRKANNREVKRYEQEAAD